ncbi:phage antirepressor N-terminal domain-containing protein (plasmid) [Arsenophonus nasoniae]|uniref:Phage antirepressor N-terminal domain-containing protein n=1 Tax=Arsenophonus nasoniae TaxID=638 RepID=A0ABY8NXP5_9GAMM|nr:phage antirepressor N-terminal domain-containing protein [Arsenophonus nasoniae]WGM09151.1 phage antirepressor N-terminal domain-containing protein [Arsenophonus nasoniae]WGM18520.1 phage antirepressor N-terminal domain-containing protein [Arsenophonus nasoniae]
MQYDNIVELPISKKANSSIINVPFHGDDLYVVNHIGEAYTPMKPIVEGMGLAWQSQFEKLKQRFKSTITEIVIVAGDGKERNMICLPLRKLAGWLQSINPNKVNPKIRNKVIRYQEECDDVLYDYWTKGIAVNPRAQKEERSIMHELNAACAELKSDKAIASLFGTGLSEWKKIKATHKKKISKLVNEAQLLLDV